MKGRAGERTIENSALIGRGRPLSVAPRTKTVPPNLAEICSKGRKTRRFRSSKAADKADSRPISIYHR